MKMKRFVAAAIAAVSCLSFAACGSDTASKDENVIHIMSSGDSSANMERALVDEYNKTADVKAVLDLVTSADYQNKLQTVMSNPKSDSAPDIFFNWADALMIQYARADVSAPLDEYMEKDPELKDNFLPSILDAPRSMASITASRCAESSPLCCSTTRRCSLTTASKPRPPSTSSAMHARS